MQQNLFYLPHSLAGLPVFGPRGWLLIAWCMVSLIAIGLLVRRRGFDKEAQGSVGVALLIGAVIAFILPQLEVRAPDGVVLGLAIRGYGVLLLCGVLAGMTTAIQSARRLDLDSEIIFSLAIWMFVGGIGGARLFYIVQYWERIRGDTLQQTLVEMVRFTEGGLVVYGALAGGLAAFMIFTTKHRLPALLLADIVAPSMAIGLALGRLGCLMNGCCYGGYAPEFPLAIEFPKYTASDQGLLSPPYAHQLFRGRLHGVLFAAGEDGPVVAHVDSGSAAATIGLGPGTRVRSLNGLAVTSLGDVAAILKGESPELALVAEDGREYRWSVDTLPDHSYAVHPTQIYAAINAFLIFLFALALFPFRTRHGQVFAAAMTIYPITRILLEIIRVDESAQFGTPLTISQIVSVVGLVGVAALWVYAMRQPKPADESS